MKRSKTRLPTRAPDRLRDLVASEFEDDAGSAHELFDKLLRSETYCRSFSLDLIDIAEGGRGNSWEIRRLAVLMLEHQILKIPARDVDEFDLLLTRLRLKSEPGLSVKINEAALKEGYTSTELRRFVPQFRRRLERLNHAHGRIRGRKTSDGALRDFISLCRQDCKLALARYVFHPDEVVGRILSRLETSRGVRDTDPLQPFAVESEAARALARMPDYEAAILERLCGVSRIYWVSDSTSSELNSLVECPLTTVVLVIKPPGSDIEFEIKRTGRRGRHKLNVVYQRDGFAVPVPHRLDGGGIGYLLRWEASVASTLAGIYRMAHKASAPVPAYHTRLSVYGVPVDGREAQLLTYFTEPRIFGEKFDELSRAMEESVAAFRREEGSIVPPLPGVIGQTVQFLNHAAPGQAIISGTSSFRLDKINEYLSPDGAAKYFAEGLRREHTNHDAKRLADTVLEEILGVFRPPAVRYRSHRQYVRDAFLVRENRERADRNYLSAMRQIGDFWGTLLALRGHSWGESFVGRNVGLKSFWEKGQWRVKLIFMDHDNLHLVDGTTKYFRPLGAFPAFYTDERFIVGRTMQGKASRSEMFYLVEIYRVGRELRKEGKTLFNQAMGVAYRKTLAAVSKNGEVRRHFDQRFVKRLRDWDEVVKSYLGSKRNGSSGDDWKKERSRALRRKGYDDALIESYFEAVEQYAGFIDRYEFLYV